MIKLPDTTLRQLRRHALATGRSVAALVRERVETPPEQALEPVYALTSDLAGSLASAPPPGGEHAPQIPAVMTAICDTGPLVAYLNRHDPYHTWAVAVMKQVRPPLLTCEAVLT